MIHVGIDISNADFDVYVNGRARKFNQCHSGYGKFLEWVGHCRSAERLVFVMEATGVYHLRLAHFLYLSGFAVAVINPRRIYHHAAANLTRVKSDASSARNIWDFAVKNDVQGDWKPLPDEITRLKFWIHRIGHLNSRITAIRNRIHALNLHTCPMEEELEALQQDLLDHKEKLRTACRKADALSDHFKSTKELLVSIPGIGPAGARALIVLFCGNYRIESARKALALAGMALRRFDSGTSVHHQPGISKTGYGALRHALYMAALSASRHNPACKALYNRLLERSKPRKQALIAVACKLLRQAFGVLKSNIPFQVELSMENPAKKPA